MSLRTGAAEDHVAANERIIETFSVAGSPGVGSSVAAHADGEWYIDMIAFDGDEAWLALAVRDLRKALRDPIVMGGVISRYDPGQLEGDSNIRKLLGADRSGIHVSYFNTRNGQWELLPPP